ncbi:GRL1A polymerase, partial [Urocolius indicus]|nr:GRL1A polymerase [Urocolius indicus]
LFFPLCFRKFIARLPDKGKKISDFAEKLTLAILQEEELARTTELLSAVKLQFQVKQEEYDNSKQQVTRNEDTLNCEDSSFFNESSNIKEVSEISSQRQEAERLEQDATSTALENHETVSEDQRLYCKVVSSSATKSYLRNDQQVSQSNTEGVAEGTGALDNMLVD